MKTRRYIACNQVQMMSYLTNTGKWTNIFSLKDQSTLTILLLFFFVVVSPGCRDRQENQMENTMTESSMDRPEFLRFLFHPRVTARTSLPAAAKDIDVTVAPEVTIGCRLFAADKDAPIILFFHGNGEIVSDYDAIGPYFQEQDLNFLVTDYRGYGWSTGTPTTSSMLGDAHILYKELLKKLRADGYTGSLFLMGRSLGSVCAIELASLHNDAIDGLIIESGFAETLPLARTIGIDIDQLGIAEEDTFNNSRKMESITKPTFILHGQLDDLIPLWQAEKLMAASGARSKELQIIPGADHNTLIAVGGILYFRAIKQFINKITGADDWRKRRRASREKQQEH